MSGSAPFKRVVAHGFAWQAVATLSTYLAGLALMPLVLKLAGPAVYGSFVVSTSLLTLLTMVVTLGSGYTARRKLPSVEEPRERGRLFLDVASFQLLTGIAAAVLLVGAMPFVERFLLQEGNGPRAIVIVLFVFSLYLSSLADTYFRSTHRIRLLSLTAIVQSVAYPCTVLLCVIAGYPVSVDVLLLSQAAAFGIFGVILWYRIGTEVKLRFRFAPIRKYAQDVRLGFPLICASLVEIALSSSDRYFLAAYLSVTHVGVYAAASAVGSLLLIVPKVASAVLVPAMARLVDAGDRGQAEDLLNGALKFFLALGLPFIAGGAILGVPLLTILATSEIAEQGRLVIPLIAIATLLYGCMNIAFNAAFITGRTGLWLRVNVLAAVLCLTLNLVLLYFFRHVETVAVTAIVCYAVALGAVLFALKEVWPIRIGAAFLGRAAFATAVMSLAVVAAFYAFDLDSHPFVAVAGLVPMGIVTYGLVLAALGVVRRDHWRYLANTFLR